VRPDDPTIPGHTLLLRALVDTHWWKLENGEPRVTSFAFTSGDEPSCYIDTPERRATMAGRFPGIPFGRFEVAVARSLGFNITLDPGGDPDGSPEHVVLTDADDDCGRSKHQKACRALARHTEFLSFEQFRALSL
jgi:hypothetical protein